MQLSSFQSHSDGWNPCWFSLPDVIWAPLPDFDVLGQGAQHKVETHCYSGGLLQLKYASQFLIIARGYRTSIFCVSTFPTNFSVGSSVSSYRTSIQLAFCWLSRLTVVKFSSNFYVVMKGGDGNFCLLIFLGPSSHSKFLKEEYSLLWSKCVLP